MLGGPDRLLQMCFVIKPPPLQQQWRRRRRSEEEELLPCRSPSGKCVTAAQHFQTAAARYLGVSQTRTQPLNPAPPGPAPWPRPPLRLRLYVMFAPAWTRLLLSALSQGRDKISFCHCCRPRADDFNPVTEKFLNELTTSLRNSSRRKIKKQKKTFN